MITFIQYILAWLSNSLSKVNNIKMVNQTFMQETPMEATGSKWSFRCCEYFNIIKEQCPADVINSSILSTSNRIPTRGH